ncbi:MAG: tripartite tricarboxylate transporter TctB family protein [Burkholderiaceae bacterium]
MPRLSTRLGDMGTGLALAGLGTWWAWHAAAMGLGRTADLGPGAFPFAVATLLALAGLGCAWRAWRRPDPDQPTVRIEPEALLGAALIVGLAVAFATLGLVVAGALFLFLMLVIVGQRRVLPSAIAAIVVTVVLALVFDRLLGVQLPTDILGLTR